MNKYHLSDDDIQNYLDGNFKNTSKIKTVEFHLDSCATCAESFKLYKNLVPNLSDDSDLLIPEEFTNRLMRRIDKETSTERLSFKLWQLIFLSVSGIISIIMVIYYSGFFTSGKIPGMYFPSGISFFKEIIDQIINFIPFQPANLAFLFYILLLLLVLGGIDKFIIRFKYH